MKKALIIILAFMLVVFAFLIVADLRSHLKRDPQIDSEAASIEALDAAASAVSGDTSSGAIQ